MTTMKDVASTAKVSTATVSRTLTTPEKVSLITRKKVENAIKQTGYIPTTLTRSVRRSESKTIVTIVPNIGDPYFSEILRGIEDTAAEHNYINLVGDSYQQRKFNQPLTHPFYTKQIDGMILLGSDLPFTVNHQEQKNLPPMVMACEYAPELQLPTIHIDNLTAAYDAVNYLTKLGHKKIAEISGPKNTTLCQFRHQGYQQALYRIGVKINATYICYGDHSFEAGAQAVTSLLALPSPPTAIFCHNDLMAIGAMSKIKEMGMRIPQDISIIGFDNIEFSRYTEPPLATVNQPRYEIGSQSMKTLLELIKGNNNHASSQLLTSSLIVRASVAPPRMSHNFV